MSHTEKQKIFDQYAKSKGIESWEVLTYSIPVEDLINYTYEACDLVQEKALKKASDKLCEIFIDDEGIIIRDVNKYCNSITNPENIIK